MTITDEDFLVTPLFALSASFVVDPVYADTVEAEFDVVNPAQPTKGPNRYTLHVPAEKTVLSLGAASSHWNTDIGITGYTDTHIQFETKEEPKTVVSLGGPATKATVKGYGDAAPVSTQGYSMVTLANAWHDAKKQHYFLSRSGDITLRTKGEGKRAVIQADEGIVDMNGATEVNIAAHGVVVGAQNGVRFEDIKYEEPWTGEAPHSLMAKRYAIFNGITNALITGHNVVMGLAKIYKEHKKGHLHASVDTFADIAEQIADFIEMKRTVSEVGHLLEEEEATANCIKMDAEEDFGVSAGGNASFYGITGATMGSTKWTSVSAVVSAGLKATLFAGVQGAYTSLKGYKKIELGCDHGKVIFDAKKSVQINAEKSVIAVGKQLAQVSGEKNAYFTGGKKAWIGTTAGSAWGLQFRKDGIMIGKANHANAMKRAFIAADRSIKIDKGGFTLKSSSSSMTLDKKAIEAKATEVKLLAKDSDVRVGGKKVLIDGP